MADGPAVTAPNAPEQLASILQDINSYSAAFNNGDANSRLGLVAAAQSLLQAMETPQETILRYIWAQPATFAAIETCINLNIFAFISWNNRSRSVADLAEATGADPEVLGRLLKHLGAVGVIIETGFDEYRGTRFSSTLAMPRYRDTFPCITGSTLPAILAIPTWLKENNYRSPTEGTNSPFNVGFQTNSHFFEYLQTKNPRYPNLPAQFNSLMSTYHHGRPSWTDEGFYPVQECLIDGAITEHNDAVFLVDVGGNKGHDLERFHAKYPSAPGRLVLQDQPSVLADLSSSHGTKPFEPMAHDFFTPQPVRGARAYFLHSVLHDWNDELCVAILRNLATSMTRGYSRLLIYENVIPDTGAHWQATSLDLVMMADVAAKERTERQWIWTVPSCVDGLIECELV
ncbi:S-adenosyl-L-methionine-dependent methyltransferase [Aspergillus taichungensis]|uniref:S-adenosyl-L-methionine-dependent methyltransferase n=1 Tax=Aspergillus taichungensis TaxID=482145 RepID=A0A2J5HQV0_9EURO|nr:S-adenosyl-L-methionine-dependent methyltransferase [Aspergillus taichungensis]